MPCNIVGFVAHEIADIERIPKRFFPIRGAGGFQRQHRQSGTFAGFYFGIGVGRVSADSVAAYPPGQPNLMPGEEITAENLTFLRETAAAPFGHVRGAYVPDVSLVRVVRR